MHLVQRFRQWQQARHCKRLIYTSAEAMLAIAARQFSEALTEAEKERLVSQWGTWLTQDEARLWGLIDQPVRTVHLFLSDVIH